MPYPTNTLRIAELHVIVVNTDGQYTQVGEEIYLSRDDAQDALNMRPLIEYVRNTHIVDLEDFIKHVAR